MKGLQALWLLLESFTLLLSLGLQSKIRKVRLRMKKQKESLTQPVRPKTSQASSQDPPLSLSLKQSQKKLPPFPNQKKTKPGKDQLPSVDGSSIGTGSSIGDEAPLATPSEIKTCSALLDLPFRAIHLAYKDVPPLTPEELEYMAEPLADIFIDLDWMKWVKLKGAYVKLGWGVSIAVISRVRGHELVKAAAKKEAAKKGSQDDSGGAKGEGAGRDDGGKGGSGAVTPGRE